MIDPKNVPNVESKEIVARFILQSNHIRPSNQTIRPDAFIPHPHPDLSVTRHRGASIEELWAVADDVAIQRGKTLYGRGDVNVADCEKQNLVVKAAPVDNNPNHANVTGWPSDKPLQKIIALEIASTATFFSRGKKDPGDSI